MLLSLPEKLTELRNELDAWLRELPLPPFFVAPPKATRLKTLPADAPPQRGGFVSCTLRALSGETVAQIHVRAGQPWLHEVPFGQLCRQWSIGNFQLLDENEIVFPRPRLAACVPSSCTAMTLQVVILDEAPPTMVKMVCSKSLSLASSRPPKTVPLYEFCELQTPLPSSCESWSCARPR